MSNTWNNILIGVSEHHSINVYWNELGIRTSEHLGRYSSAREQNVEIENQSFENESNSYLIVPPMPSTLLFIVTSTQTN